MFENLYEPADALIAAEDHQKRRAEASPSIPPKQPPLGVLSPCRYQKGQTCECGGRGLCLRRGMTMKRAASLLLLFAAACTMNGSKPVAGWPQLEVVEHYVPAATMRARCAPYVGFGMMPEACAELDLKAKRCDLWFNADFPPSKTIIAHEREHCAGYPHIGDGSMDELLTRWKAAHGK